MFLISLKQSDYYDDHNGHDVYEDHEDRDDRNRAPRRERDQPVVRMNICLIELDMVEDVRS